MTIKEAEEQTRLSRSSIRFYEKEQTKHGSVWKAVAGITVDHEMVGIVESVGDNAKTVQVQS